MHSKRILSIQKRAKRRLFFMAIVGTAVVGYSALSLFAQDGGASQTTVSKMNSTPGVKAVGIRLINSNASSAPLSAPPSTSSSMPTLLLPPAQKLPPAFDLPPATKTATDVPFSAAESAPKSTVSGFASLPVPPRMSDVLPSNPSGKVVMKLSSGNEATKEPVEPPTPPIAASVLPPQVNNESVEIRVIQPMLLGEPTSLPPLVVEKPKKQGERVETPKLPTPPMPNRLSLADTSLPESSSAPITEARKVNSDANKATEPKPRAPKLVKSKPTQIAHMVVLAQSAELDHDAPAIPTAPEIERQTVIETATVPHSVSRIAVDKEKKGKAVSDTKKNNLAQVSTKDAIPESSFELEPSASNVIASALDRNTNDVRRKFDTRASKQSVAAAIELESSSATNIDVTGKLLGLAVQDESVCKIIQNDRMVSLIGNQVGTTLVQIWSSDLEDKPQVIRVNVTQKKGRVQTGRDDVKEIKQVVAQNFPRAEVNITNQSDGSIEVLGTTDSEESAKRILELIRKVYLVPVKDKLVVSN